MAKNRFNKYMGLLALGLAAVAVSSCKDTWEEHYGYSEGENTEGMGTQTLWELISTNPDLSKFADIARHAKYWKDEKHPVDTYSYADVLNSGQMNTAWIPSNSYLSDADYQYWLDMCETDGYAVQQQFIGNHIALWRHVLAPGDGKPDTIRMINGKNFIFDKVKGTLQGIDIATTLPSGAKGRNIAALNGTLHILEGTPEFKFNFYEYLKYGKNTKKFTDYLVSKDTVYFSQGASIEGLPDKDGNPTYVDSVYYTSNRLMQSRKYLPATNPEAWDMAEKGFAAPVNAEDSMYIMLIPTDAAWEATKAKLAPYYKYAPEYVDNSKGNNGTSATRKIDDTDSLSNMSITMDMVSPLVFNINKQAKIGGQSGQMWTLDRFLESKGDEAEYLLNTYGDTLRNVKDANGNIVWDKTSLFNGEVRKMSNGYAYEINDWNFPIQFYKPDVVVEMGYGVFYNTANLNNYKLGGNTKSQAFSNNTFSLLTERYGKVSKDNFFYLAGQSLTANPKCQIKLKGNLNEAYVPEAEVMSGKYKLQIVTVPTFYKKFSDEGGIDSTYFDEEGNLIEEMITNLANSYKFKVTLTYINAAGKEVTTKAVTVTSSGEKVDTVEVAIDSTPEFEFPVSYKNMRFCYPTLTIEGAVTTSDAKKGYSYQIPIDRIILKNVDFIPEEKTQNEGEEGNGDDNGEANGEDNEENTEE